MKSSAQSGYLAGEGPEGLGPVLRQMSVFLCVDELRGRGVYGLHMPMRERCAAMLKMMASNRGDLDTGTSVPVVSMACLG
jgi:hypothetical protein